MTIGWGSYLSYEGPWTRGTQPFTISASPTEEERIVAVITATEGGTYDAVNMYDVCLWTVGIIQWCNRAPQHSVDDMLGVAYTADPTCMQALQDLAAERDYSFGRVGSVYRFSQAKNLVDSVRKQQRLYFLNATGEQGSWDEDSEAWARRWAAASTAVWTSEAARKAQLAYTVRRLPAFAAGIGRKLLDDMPDTNIAKAWRAMYLSFAANNPAKAAQAVGAAQKACEGILSTWSAEWLTHQAYYLTTNPGIAIYPERYNKIRPVLEHLYGVLLPDRTDELRKWSLQNFRRDWYEVVELQRGLISLGYDLGPKGADGTHGQRVVRALQDFQKRVEVPEYHRDGYMNIPTAIAFERALEVQAYKELT